MSTATEEALRKAGVRIDPEDLDRLIAQAVRDVVPRQAVLVDPRAEFSPAERMVLEEGGVDLGPLRDGEETALVRTAAEYGTLLASSLTVRQVAERLGVDESRVRQRLAAHQLYGIRRPSGWLLPLFQFHGERLAPGIERVLPRLDARLHPLAVLGWFTRPHPDLHRPGDAEEAAISPLDWLRVGGDPDVVCELVEDAIGYS